MSDHAVEVNQEERPRLLPVVGVIVAIYATILTSAYVVGNLIYQIP